MHYKRYVTNISESGIDIYEPIDVDNPDLWIPTKTLEKVLNDKLAGISLGGLALRTRSKKLKEEVCKALGYPVPKTFKKTQPRFPGQAFDTYVQKANNLQVWNEEISPTRRYVVIRLSGEDIIEKVKVLLGEELALLDKTGTLTQKYQARLTAPGNDNELITPLDTENLQPVVSEDRNLEKASPVQCPNEETLISIGALFEKLSTLSGEKLEDSGIDQERNRGGELHKLICERIGYREYKEDGQFPDIKNQLLEIKLQTSPTIDLGLVKPDSLEELKLPPVAGRKLRHCDVRYAVFAAEIIGKEVHLKNLFLTTGEGFFGRFPQFQGKVVNKKIQIPLPKDLFN